MTYIPLLVILGVFLWLFVIRPQRRRNVEQQRLLDSIAPGVEVLTAGGLYATVQQVDDDDVRLEIAPGVQVRAARRAIAAVLTEEDAERGELARAQREAQAEALAGHDTGDR